MERIEIICSEKEKENIMRGLIFECPFEGVAVECIEDCKTCVNKNIKFTIK